MKLTVALLLVEMRTMPAWAGGSGRSDERPPLPDGTVPLTNNVQGPAKTALPEQAASPMTKEERPDSAESEKADRLK